jgi:hypothetical protein
MKNNSLAKAQTRPHTEAGQSDQAAVFREKLNAAVREIAEAKRQVTTGYHQLFEGAKGDTSEKLCWRGIVWYANADLESSKADRMRLPFLLSMIVEKTLQFFGVWPTGDLSIFADLREYASSAGCPIEDALPALAKVYQADVQRLLSWLSSPDKNAETAQEAVDFLLRHTRGIQTKIDVNPEFDDTGNKGYPFLWEVTDIRCPSVVTPLCEFIFKQIDHYHQGGISLAQAIPVLKCKRPGCGRFMVPGRAGRKEYCSDNCRARHRLEFLTASGEQRDYMWLRRLERPNKDEVDYKLMMPKVVKRLSMIEKKWPKLAKKARRLLQRANDPSVQLARSVWELADDPSVQKTMSELADDLSVREAISELEADPSVQEAISWELEDDPSVQKARSLLEHADDPTARKARRLLKRAYK